MAWQDRLKQASYTSPQGDIINFDYEDVSTSVDKKTTAFSFPDANGTFIQDLGSTARQYPLKVIFHGDDYDLAANAFEEILLQPGIGTLQHPIYGKIEVVPFGTISRTDALKTAGNQAIIQVTFWKTIGIVYPSSQADPSSSVVSSIEAYNASASSDFDNLLQADTASETTGFKNTYENLLDTTQSVLSTIADAQDNVSQQFNSIYRSINEGIDTLVSEPLNLAFQTTLLIQSPARALTSITARLSAYRDLANSLIRGDGAVVTPGYDNVQSNDFHTRDLYVKSYVTGSVLSTVNNQFDTKSDALAAADSLLSFLDEVTNWRDDNFSSLSQIDTGASYQDLQNAVALAAGFLVAISFSLKQEKTIILDRNRTVIDLVAQLYGEVDNQLDFFINSNNLTGSEILELPAGRQIVYYV